MKYLNYLKLQLIKSYHIIIPLLLLIVSATYILLYLSFNNEGKITYSFDDGYIHMAYDKNIVNHGIWGVSKYESSATTSSLLWTIILSTFYNIFGVYEYTPLILNTFFLFTMLYSIFLFSKKFMKDKLLILSMLLMTLFCSKLLLIYMSGMEHILFNIFVINSIFLVSIIIKQDNISSKYNICLMINTFFMCFTRYEGYILLIISVLLLFLFKKRKISLILFIWGIITYLCDSFIKYFNTGSYSSNSLILKTKLKFLFSENVLNDLLTSFGYQFEFTTGVLFLGFLLIFVAIILIKNHRLSNKLTIDISAIGFLAFFFAIVFSLVSLEFNIRYLNNLYSILIVSIFISIDFNFSILKETITKQLKIFILLISISFSTYGCISDINKTILASQNIYQQQYQVALFLDKYYSESKILLNDIGAINYFAEVRNIDFAGLANDIYSKKLIKRNEIKNVREFINESEPEIGVLYNSWLNKFGLPDTNWIEVATWTISNNYICGDSIVTYYVFDNNSKYQLLRNLKKFCSLSKKVKVNYY